MKNSNKDLKSLLTAPQEKTYMVSLLNSTEFKSVLRRYGRVFTRILFVGSKVQSRLQILTRFGDMLLRITKNHGPVFTVKYLKALTVALQRYIGGRPLSSLREIEPNLPLPRLTSCGLPAFIPLRERVELKRLTPSVVRWWLTILSVYRIISVPGKIKLETITAPYGGNKEFLLTLSTWLLGNSKGLVSLFVKSFEPKASLGLEHILKSSPSSTVSWKGFISDAARWEGRTEFFQFANFGQFSLYFDWFNIIKLIKLKILPPEVPLDNVKAGADTASPMPLGQLALKEEAAGKIRVFAMVDIWTQSVLKPLHDWLFRLFHSLPNDSTHNQDVGFLRAKEKANQYGHAWCYDLSAATDRLPIQLQSAILDSLFGHIPCSGHDTGITYGQAWASLLTTRVYHLRKSEFSDSQDVKYAVGQPMGAYSSWAMLNLCHHLILQYICINLYTKVKWYECYEVLGDDIVIFDERVASRYLEVMEGLLDVKCNQSKSLIAPSRPVIEFAKRVSIGQAEVSAFSWRQMRSFDSLMGRACIAADIVARRHVSAPIRAFKAIVGPQWGPVPSYQYSLISFAGVLVNRGVLSFQLLSDFLVDPKNPIRFIGGRIIANVRTGVLENWIVQYSKGFDLTIPRIDYQALGRLLRLNQAAARGYLEDQIVDLYKKVGPVTDSTLMELKRSFDPSENAIGRFIPNETVLSLFYPGSRYRDSVRLVDLDTLSFEELADRVDRLQQIQRDINFFKMPVKRALVLEDSFKLLRLIMKSRRKGSISMPVSGVLYYPKGFETRGREGPMPSTFREMRW